MANFFVRYWKKLAITSISITSSYFFFHDDYSRVNNRLLSALKVQAAEYRRNARKALSKNWQIERRKDIDDDDDDDVDDEENDKDDLNIADKTISNIRERRFRDFASIEYNEEIYMTPIDFLESVIAERPRRKKTNIFMFIMSLIDFLLARIGRRELTEDIFNSILYSTPPKHRGSKRFFRNLEDAEPSTQFEIAFAMFDTDGNQLVDKHEFLVLGKVMSDKRMIRRQSNKHSSSKSNLTENRINYFD
ncbi:unnamed protein product, partial [Rotaria sp. Silwood2]